MLYPILLFPLLATTKASYYKTLRISKLQKMDRSHSKLVSFLLSVTFTGLDKHTGLYTHTSLRDPYIMNP